MPRTQMRVDAIDEEGNTPLMRAALPAFANLDPPRMFQVQAQFTF
jgi:hypothetical protein